MCTYIKESPSPAAASSSSSASSSLSRDMPVPVSRTVQQLARPYRTARAAVPFDEQLPRLRLRLFTRRRLRVSAAACLPACLLSPDDATFRAPERAICCRSSSLSPPARDFTVRIIYVSTIVRSLTRPPRGLLPLCSPEDDAHARSGVDLVRIYSTRLDSFFFFLSFFYARILPRSAKTRIAEIPSLRPLLTHLGYVWIRDRSRRRRDPREPNTVTGRWTVSR